MRNIVDKLCSENKKQNITNSITFPQNRAFYEMDLKNVVQPDSPLVAV
jgi:hypothetical protein